MRIRRGLTLVEALVTFAVIALALLIALPILIQRRRKIRQMRCANNLTSLAKGMATYLNPHNGRFYPCPLGRGHRPDDYNGAEWLASLYWTGVIPDPGVFLCPSTSDTNADGPW
ncbi:MAG: prepilin-type N-terminal cleavage/methylation domain-containing protein, partial [Planctomycetota bacterium]